MPAGHIYPKAIQNINAVVSNGFLGFSYDVIENYNADTFSGTNTNQYSYQFPITAISLKLITIDGVSSLFEMSCQNEQVSFAKGEYLNISTGDTLDIGDVYGLIVSTLGI